MIAANNTVLLQRLVELDKAEKELKATAAKISAERDEVEQQVIQLFIEEGVQNVRLEDGTTVFLWKQSNPKMRDGVDRARVIAALVESGNESLVQPNFNSTTVAALMREYEREGQVPIALANVYEMSERVEARVRHGEKSSKEDKETNDGN